MTIKKTLGLIAIVAVCAITSCKQTNTANTAGSKSLVVPDSDTVSVKTAQRYVKNYASRAGTVYQLIGDKGKDDTRCVWYSIDRLDSLVQQIKREKGNGIRFYICTYDMRYPDSTSRRYPQKAHWGYNTLLMVSTKSWQGKNWDYYNNIPSNDNPENKKGVIRVMSDPQNRGEICPPPGNCNLEGATLLQY